MRTVVGVLRGGTGNEYEHSLTVGAHVLQELDKEKYEPRDIFLDRSGQWHVHGVGVLPEQALRGVDVALSAVHGEFGHGGELQRILETLGVPFVGSRSHAAALVYNAPLAKATVRKMGIRVARALGVETEGKDISRLAHDLFRSFPQPMVVSPVGKFPALAQGGFVVDNFNALQWSLERAAAQSSRVLLEEYISGVEVGTGVIDRFRDEDVYALIPSGGSISKAQKDEVAALAKKVHQGLGLSHYSHSDFVVSKRGVFFSGVSSYPALASKSRFVEALEEVGAKLTHFLDHIISLALNKK